MFGTPKPGLVFNVDSGVHPRIVQQSRNVAQNGRARSPSAPKGYANRVSRDITQLRRAHILRAQRALRSNVTRGGRARPTDSIVCTIRGCAAIAGSVAEAYWGVPKELAAKAESYLEPEMVEVLKKFQLRHHGSIID